MSLPVPNIPLELSGIAVSKTEVKLNWTDNSQNENGFKIECKIGEEGGIYSNSRVG